jgi:hypothetical protein
MVDLQQADLMGLISQDTTLRRVAAWLAEARASARS